MPSAESLEILITSNPKTLTSTIRASDTRKIIAQATFEDRERLTAWAPTLDEIAQTTRNVREATIVATGAETALLPATAPSLSTADSNIPAGNVVLPPISMLGGRQSTATSAIGPTALGRESSMMSIVPRTATTQAAEAQSPPHTDGAGESNKLLQARALDTPTITDIEAANTLFSLPTARIIRAGHPSITGLDVSLPGDASPMSIPARSDPGDTASLGPSMSSRTSVSTIEQTHASKRSKKLNLLLQRIRDQANPDPAEHNEKVKNLCDSTISFTSVVPATAEQLGNLLGDLGHVSDVLGFIYGLLSWEVFRREEYRLITEEGQSARWAAKQMNQKMSKHSNRHATSHDWASDGRRAAGMVFGSIADLSPAKQSLAVFLLADLAILDNLVKIAHFPVLKERFARVFREIHQARGIGGRLSEVTKYQVFGFESFLSLRRISANIGLLPRPSQASAIEQSMPASLIYQHDHSQSDAGHTIPVTIDESPQKRRRVSSQLSTTLDAEAIWPAQLEPNKGIDKTMKNNSASNISQGLATDARGASSIGESVDHRSSSAGAGTAQEVTDDSQQNEDYDILFGPSPDFENLFTGQ